MRNYEVTYMHDSRKQTILIEASDEAEAGKQFVKLAPDVDSNNVLSVVDTKKKGIAKTTNIVLIFIGAAIAVWVFTRLTGVGGQLHSWQPPFSDFEIGTMIGGAVAFLLLLFGVLGLLKK